MTTISPFAVSKSSAPGDPIEKISISSRHRFIENARSHTRYVRKDIEVTIREGRLFGSTFAPARLIDISQQGVSIFSNKLLLLNKKLFLKFSFEDGQSFLFRARVVRRIKPKGLPYIYGAEFENRDDVFKDHLLKTQLRLNLNKQFFIKPLPGSLSALTD